LNNLLFLCLDAEIHKQSFQTHCSSLHFGVSESIYNFTGRDEELQTLKDSLTSSSASNLTVVSGMGGVGKTCLVRHFVSMEEWAEWNIIWLATETEKELKTSIEEAAKTIGERISQEVKLTLEHPFEKQLGDFYNHLDSLGRRTMLIFDNADDKFCKFDDSRLEKYFSRSIKKHYLSNVNFEHPKVIVTTRRENFSSKFSITRIKLSPLTKPEAIKLCETSLNSFKEASVEDRSKIQKDIKRLCSCLGNYSLALQQAIACLNEMMGNTCIEKFIEQYRETVKIFENEHAKLKVDCEYMYTVATVFNLSFKVIERTKNALELMYILSFCKPESTKVEFFERLYGEAVANHAIAALRRFNLIARIKYPNHGKKIVVHRVVQRVVQDRVLLNPGLIEIVFRAGITSMYPYSDREKFSSSDIFPVLKTLSLKNQKIDRTDCTIRKIYDRDWDLVQTNETATFIVLGVAFFQFYSESTWQQMFGAEKLQIARDLLENTCFRHISDEYFFPKEINQIIWESTVRSKTLSSLLWDRLDVDKLFNRLFYFEETSKDLLKSNFISVQEKSLLLSLLCECIGIGSPKDTTFNKLYMELLKSRCIVVPNEVDELWLEKSYQNRGKSQLLVLWYISDRMNWREFIFDAICLRSIDYKRTMEPTLHVLLLHLCVQVGHLNRLYRVRKDLHLMNVSVESVKFPSLQFLLPAARSKYIDDFNSRYESLKSQLRKNYEIRYFEKAASFLTKQKLTNTRNLLAF